MEYLAKEDYYYKKQIDNKWIAYNPDQNMPIKLNEKSKLLFEFLVENDYNIEKCSKTLSAGHYKELINLFDLLKKNKFIYKSKEEIKSNPKGMNKDTCQIYIHLTDRCNLKCTYCYNEYFRGNQKELSFENLKIIIDKLIYYTSSITLTGGEPLLHKNFKDIVNYIKDKKPDVHLGVITNGIIDVENILDGELTILDKLDAIKLSCDKLHGSQEERIGFNADKFKKNIKFLLKHQPPNKLEIASVYTKHLDDDIIEIKSYSAENCIKHYLALRIPTEISDDEISKVPTPEDFDNLKKKVDSIAPIEQKKKTKKVLYKNTTCGAANTIFSVDVIGDMYPCQSFHFPDFNLGNIITSNFNDIFASNPANNVRNHTSNDTATCNVCKLKNICGSGCKADTYKHYGSMSHFPEFMHQYYEKAAINKLETIWYE